MSRTITTFKDVSPKPESVSGDPVKAIKAQANPQKYQYLLAYADDGVIWGRVERDKLVLSGDAFPHISPKLRPETLWEARLFGENAEWYLWKADQGWQSREITDSAGKDVEAFDEDHILWGTNVEKSKPPFTLVCEADMGIRHAPPISLRDRHSLKLKVRHYLDYDEAGAVFVKYSRLVDLSNGDVK